MNESFETVSQELTEFINARNVQGVVERVERFLLNGGAGYQKHLVNAVACYIRGEFAAVDDLMRQGRALMADPDQMLLETGNLYSLLWIKAQMYLDRRQRQATRQGYENFKAGLAALKEVNPELADGVRAAVWPAEWTLVDFWTGLHLLDHARMELQRLTDPVRDSLMQHVRERAPVGFSGIGTGQEVLFCLDHRFHGIHGMERVHYVSEPDLGRLRALLHLRNLSGCIQTGELALFGGENALRQAGEFFSTLRYASPSIIVGDYQYGVDFYGQINRLTESGAYQAEVNRYYGSEAFRRRQQEIARGETLPRLLFVTCRWTTFLKYSAMDFNQAYQRLGCETRFLIEEKDVQHLSPALVWRTLQDFKPDGVFMVSHARPTIDYIPRELPVIGYIQDKCGKVLTMPDWTGHFSRQDYFICLCPYLEELMMSRRVPAEQIMMLPQPVDETMYYPLAADHPDAGRFAVDISFVKHGHADPAVLLEEFLEQCAARLKDRQTAVVVERLFRSLYAASTTDCDQRYYEKELWGYVRTLLPLGLAPEAMEYVQKCVSSFYITVHSAAWRSYYLEALDQAGIQLALYGNDWQKHSKLGHLSRGSIDREKQLKSVYNFSRINLHISQAGTMHQRLVECALSGGFMMVSDHDPEKDYAPARPWFAEGRELVYYWGAADLVDKCCYYLAHEQERREIAGRFRQRALDTLTIQQGARQVLENWRAHLRRVPMEQTI